MTRNGTYTPATAGPVTATFPLTVDIDPEDNMPTRASVEAFVGRGTWYLDVPWDADRDDGSTVVEVRHSFTGAHIGTLELEA
jgi:hypothetical protein